MNVAGTKTNCRHTSGKADKAVKFRAIIRQSTREEKKSCSGKRDRKRIVTYNGSSSSSSNETQQSAAIKKCYTKLHMGNKKSKRQKKATLTTGLTWNDFMLTPRIKLLIYLINSLAMYATERGAHMHTQPHVSKWQMWKIIQYIQRACALALARPYTRWNHTWKRHTT